MEVSRYLKEGKYNEFRPTYKVSKKLQILAILISYVTLLTFFKKRKIKKHGSIGAYITIKEKDRDKIYK